MAKHKGGKKKSGKKKKKHKNPKRVAAGKKAWRKMKREGKGIAGKSKKYKRKGKGKKHAAKSRKYVGGMTMGQKLKARALVKRLEARGYTHAEAESRVRKLISQASKKVKAAAERAAQRAANQSALNNMFAGFGMAGAAAQVLPMPGQGPRSASGFGHTVHR